MILYSLGWKVCVKPDTDKKRDSFDQYDKTLINSVKRELTEKIF